MTNLPRIISYHFTHLHTKNTRAQNEPFKVNHPHPVGTHHTLGPIASLSNGICTMDGKPGPATTFLCIARVAIGQLWHKRNISPKDPINFERGKCNK